MERAKTIHFNLAGVNWGAAVRGEGYPLTAEWELSKIFESGWLPKTLFYFGK